ncbi:MAG TPA: arginine--tRNA ligase [Patescibacteria group bacterium]|nr:arginine--tRNA ligase [Patescibacteria group bacterium]
MDAKEVIIKSLEAALGGLGVTGIVPEVKLSDKSENGDYYTNVAMRIAGVLHEKPLDIAYKIKSSLDTLDTPDTHGTFQRVDVAPPGFINFTLSKKYLSNIIAGVMADADKFGKTDLLKSEKIMIEFTDPNPFKEFHIGHLYVNIVGESLCRMYEAIGGDVQRVCYQGDVGLHVAKAIFGMQALHDQMPVDSAPINIKAQFLGKAYANGATKFEESDATKQEIYKINKAVYEKDPSIVDLYRKGRTWSLEYFETIYKRLGMKFEHYYFESEVQKIGTDLVREYLKKGIFEESDGAIIFPGKKFGLHNRVFINSLGLPTYEAKDMGLAGVKYKDFAYDKSIIITGQEQAEYFKVIIKALSQINPDLAAKTSHIANGLVRLPTGKMSSRTGDVITGEWLMDEAVGRIQKEFPDMDDVTAEKVGMAAIKFALLKSAIGGNIEFNFDDSIALSGASGPYIQYTYVRTQSVLRKGVKDSGEKIKDIAENDINSEEANLMRHISYYPEVVSIAAEKLSPNLVAEYLFALSQKFNFFYQKHKIGENQFRLDLTMAVGITLKNGLKLLGIETVEKM